MAQKSLRRPIQWMAAMSCRRPSLSGPDCAWTPHGFSLWGFPSPLGAAGERSDFNIKPPLGAPLLIVPWGNLLESIPQVDTSAWQRGFEIRVSPLLGELPKAIEPHLPVCQLFRWQLGPSMWTSHTIRSLDPTVVTALRVGFPGESHGHATCGFACNCPEPEAWTTEAWSAVIIVLIVHHSELASKGYMEKLYTTYKHKSHKPKYHEAKRFWYYKVNVAFQNC